MVRVRRLCQSNKKGLLPHSGSRSTERGVNHVTVSQVITHDLALPISSGLGSQVSLPDLDGVGRSGSGTVHSSVLRTIECGDCGVEYSGRHVHLLVLVPPKVSISEFMGTIKGRTAIRVLNKFRHLKRKPYWGNHFWARGYCVDTVGLDAEKIRKYVKFQEDNDKRSER